MELLEISTAAPNTEKISHIGIAMVAMCIYFVWTGKNIFIIYEDKTLNFTSHIWYLIAGSTQKASVIWNQFSNISFSVELCTWFSIAKYHLQFWFVKRLHININLIVVVSETFNNLNMEFTISGF